MNRLLSSLALIGLLSPLASAQPPREIGARRGGGQQAGNGVAVANSVKRLMSLDKNKDGLLTTEEVTDNRLLSIFHRADTDGDGSVTQEDLTNLVNREAAAQNEGMGRGGPGGFGGPGPGGPGPGGGGPGGFGGPGGPPMFKPGTVLPEPMLDSISASDEQRAAIAKLQATVDAELAKILTSEQLQMLQQPPRGPGGFGGPNSFGGQGGPGEEGLGQRRQDTRGFNQRGGNRSSNQR